MERLRVRGAEIPFEPAVVPDEPRKTDTRQSTVLFERQHGDRSNAELELDRAADGIEVTLTSLRSGRQQLQMMKVTGSAFADFARDEYTTLPERKDRPLLHPLRRALAIRRSRRWRWAIDMARYVAGEQVADICSARLPSVREPVDPAPGARDRPAHAGALAAAVRGVVRGPEPAVGPGRHVRLGPARQGLLRIRTRPTARSGSCSAATDGGLELRLS